MSSSERLRVHDLTASWGAWPVLRGISFDLAKGEFLVLMGPNGSGKTTLLRCLAGLEPTTGGWVEIDGARIDALPPHRRGVGMLFQDPALFPRRTVRENIAYGPQVAHQDPGEVDRRVADLVERLHLTGLEERPADRLSGGERQRVALARTLAARPRLVLLDEPFAAVDMEIKAELRSEFRDVLRELGMTAIHVTHDREEALFLGDRVAVLMDGRIVQIGAPRAVHDAPEDPEVARFLGYNVRTTADAVEAVHPDDVAVVAGGSDARVVAVGPAGRSTQVHVRTSTGERWVVRVDAGVAAPAAGEVVGLRWTRSITFPPRPRTPR